MQSNRAAEEILPVVQAFCEMTGAAHTESVVMLPAYDVLPFENLSPHPEIQEARATALWKIVSGAARIVITPFVPPPCTIDRRSSTSISPRSSVAATRWIPTNLRGHLNTVGYSAVDVVEMPGEYALRGGILDVYPPESERPVRVELFGDEVESIRKFDPQYAALALLPSTRSSSCPLTDTPVREDMLGAIHARLSGRASSKPTKR